MTNKHLIIIPILLTSLLSCQYSFDKNDLKIISTYNVGDTLVFKSDSGLYDSLEIIDKQFRYNGISEGYSGNPETGYIVYRSIPPSEPELVGFGGSKGDVYSNEKYLLSAVKWDKHKRATIDIKYGGFSGEIPNEEKLITDKEYGTYFDITHFCINCNGVDSNDVVKLKWKPGVGIIWYQKKDNRIYKLVAKS
ncbi:MAG: hypothetical protein IPO42_10360 [Chitinophagaceae bacterium]|nr:hypothetical protein [Chitinophagaceae bacterium]